MFPIFKNDRKPIVGINREQKHGVESLVQKIESGVYILEENPCQCLHPKDAETTVEKDMYGIPNENVLCANCGLIRSRKILDAKSLQAYYDNEYKPINYNKNIRSSEDYYQSQLARGKQFFKLIQEHQLIDAITNVYDMGCGAGGVMHYFHEAGISCAGNDYSESYLSYGNARGMHLRYGEMPSDLPGKESVDLFILAHVYEHLSEPLKVLKDIFSRIKIGGYLLMEVPGVFANIPAKKGYPAAYHQFAHVVNFYHETYLRALFDHENLKIVYGDERCTFLIQKLADVSNLRYPINTTEYEKVKQHLVQSDLGYKSYANLYYLKRRLKAFLRF